MGKKRKVILIIIGFFIVTISSLILIKPLILKMDFSRDSSQEKKLDEFNNKGTINLGLNVIYEGDGITFNDNTITITLGGTYEIVGNLPNGKILIDTLNPVTLNLKSININNNYSAIIEATYENEVTINLDGESNLNSDASNVIDIKGNLIFEGYGKLNILNNSGNGIKAKNITLNEGDININAHNNSFVVEDDINIKNGSLQAFYNGDILDINSDIKTVMFSLPTSLSTTDTLSLIKNEEDFSWDIKPLINASKIIIINSLIRDGSYNLIKNKDSDYEKVIINESDTYDISKNVNIFS